MKRSESGMIVDPITLPPHATLGDAEALMRKYKISGVPITDEAGMLVAFSPIVTSALRRTIRAQSATI